MSPRWPGMGWLLCGAALVVRAGWIVWRWNTRGPTFDYPDEDLHWQLATNLVRDGLLISDDGRFAARMPLYPLFLAAFAGVGQTGILLAKLAQAVLGAATVGVVFGLARRALNARAALVAGLLACGDPFGVFFSNLLLSETLFTLLLVGLLACARDVGSAARTGQRSLMGLALLGPAAVLTRPSAVLLVPVLWLLTLAARRQRGVAAGRLLLCPLLLVTLVLPWGLRNRAVLGSFAWLSTNGGVTLYDAQGPQADGSSNQEFLNADPRFADLDEVTLDRVLTRLSLEQMRRDPVRVLRLARVKLLRTWSPVPNVAEYRRGWPAWVGAVYTVALLTGAVVGLTRALRDPQRRTLHAWLWSPILYFTLLHCIYIGSVRYRVPLMPLLGLAAACSWAPTVKPAPAGRGSVPAG